MCRNIYNPGEERFHFLVTICLFPQGAGSPGVCLLPYVHLEWGVQDRHCLPNFQGGVFPLPGCILRAGTLAGKALAGISPATCHPGTEQVTRTASTPAQLTTAPWRSAAVQWFEIHLLHFFFLPRTEEVNRHLSRRSPGLIVWQSLARHFQWRTLDSGALFQGSPEQIHWPVGHSQAFTWRRNGWAGFVLKLCTEKRENYCAAVIWWTLCTHSVLGTYYTWNGN